jgi:hypothetical protein
MARLGWELSVTGNLAFCLDFKFGLFLQGVAMALVRVLFQVTNYLNMTSHSS